MVALDHVDGVAMGSCHSVHEKVWHQELDPRLCCIGDMLDDVHFHFKTMDSVAPFLKYLNSRNPKIRFKVEFEVEGNLQLLNVLVERRQDKFFVYFSFAKVNFYGF